MWYGLQDNIPAKSSQESKARQRKWGLKRLSLLQEVFHVRCNS